MNRKEKTHFGTLSNSNKTYKGGTLVNESVEINSVTQLIFDPIITKQVGQDKIHFILTTKSQ